MVPIAANHSLDIVNCKVLPFLIADVLPAGNFFQHQQTVFVARIQEMRRLRIVRRAHDIAFEIFAQNPRVPTLHARGHGLTDEGERLMAIQTAQLQVLAVEKETISREASLAKAYASFVLIDDALSLRQSHEHLIKPRPVDAPEIDVAKIIQR